MGINFSPIRRGNYSALFFIIPTRPLIPGTVVTGFLFGALTMLVGAILQWQVYKTSPCGYYATECTIGTTVSPLSVWAQMPLYVVPAIGELLVNITSYEMYVTSSVAICDKA